MKDPSRKRTERFFPITNETFDEPTDFGETIPQTFFRDEFREPFYEVQKEFLPENHKNREKNQQEKRKT